MYPNTNFFKIISKVQQEVVKHYIVFLGKLIYKASIHLIGINTYPNTLIPPYLTYHWYSKEVV